MTIITWWGGEVIKPLVKFTFFRENVFTGHIIGDGGSKFVFFDAFFLLAQTIPGKIFHVFWITAIRDSVVKMSFGGRSNLAFSDTSSLIVKIITGKGF